MGGGAFTTHHNSAPQPYEHSRRGLTEYSVRLRVLWHRHEHLQHHVTIGTAGGSAFITRS